jgi:hypothetical protein
VSACTPQQLKSLGEVIDPRSHRPTCVSRPFSRPFSRSWTAHLRCTDRARKGDNERAMVLARWGGMGHHRYQVSVDELGCLVSTWQ